MTWTSVNNVTIWRCSKFVDIVSSHTSPSPAQPQQPGLTVTLSGVTR